jgi:hypothetical protein
MKNLKNIVILLIPVTLIIYMFIWDFGNIKYLKYLLTEVSFTPGRWMEIWKFLLGQLLTIFDIVAPIVYLATQNAALKNKLYKLIRFTYVITVLFAIPPMFLRFLHTTEYASGSSLLIYLRYLILFFTAAVLWVAKPEDDIPFVSLKDYAMVSYTSKGNRLLHHIVDILFCTTISFDWMLGKRSSYNPYEDAIISSLISSANLFVYYLFSELLFRQTLGKILTNSCVVATRGTMGGLRILGRTFARFIPFDVLSFLGNGNWHDKVSGTTVVYTNSWEDIVFEDEAERQ